MAVKTYNENQQAVEDWKKRSSQLAEDTKNNTVAQNEQSLSDTSQTLDIISQRLQKYIPTYNRAQNITGGLAESTRLKANVNAQNQYAAMQSDYNKANLQAQNDYGNTMRDIENEYATRIQTAQANDADLANADLNSVYDAIDADTSKSDVDKYKAKLEAYNEYKDQLGANSVAQEAYAKALENSIRSQEQGGKTDEQTSNLQEAQDIDERLSGKIYNTAGMSMEEFKSLAKVKGGARQNEYLETLFKSIKNGVVPNGSLITLNFGNTTNYYENAYIYYDGKLYKFSDGSSISTKEQEGAWTPKGYYVTYGGGDVFQSWGEKKDSSQGHVKTNGKYTVFTRKSAQA